MEQSSFLEGETPVDFLYLDRNRVASLIGQLSDKGVLTGLESIVERSQSTEGGAAGSIKVVTGSMGRSRSSSESSKETYDPFWPHAYTFLEDLEANFAVPLDKARIGSLVKFEALIQFVDLKLLRNFWEPSVRAFLSSSPKPPTRQQKRHQERRGQGASQSLSPEMENVIQVLQSMPHLFHMTFVTESGIALWAAVQPSNLTINSEDLAMKFGAAMDGIWTVVGILDGQPGEPAKPIPLGSAMLDLAVEAMANLRTVVGRPKTHLGLTPIAIYAPLIGMAEITAEPLESNSPPPS